MNNIDPVLMFECLIYLNIFHYALFATCETIMTTAKYVSIVNTPNIGRDAGVVFTKLTVELTKIIVFEKYRKKRRRTMIAVALFLTLITIGTLVYAFGYQKPMIKLEYILNTLTAMLTCTEVFFGIWSLIPRRKQYYY